MSEKLFVGKRVPPSIGDLTGDDYLQLPLHRKFPQQTPLVVSTKMVKMERSFFFAPLTGRIREVEHPMDGRKNSSSLQRNPRLQAALDQFLTHDGSTDFLLADSFLKAIPNMETGDKS
ncbi:hypothetical protein EJ110_NYTH46692 [Nymphaea thermarum]|nr:hypothetical protein EJ110_NYTH46692 [Nymphaea thermarum]